MAKVLAAPYDIKLLSATVGAKRKQPEPLTHTLDEQLADAERTVAIYQGLWEVAEKRAVESHAHFLSLPTGFDEDPYRMGQFEYYLEQGLHYTDANDTGMTLREFNRLNEDRKLWDLASTCGDQEHEAAVTAWELYLAAQGVATPLQKAVRARELDAFLNANRRRIAELDAQIERDEAEFGAGFGSGPE